ncbi:uncharacterized protein A4U43_C04F6630 [Asparagus officinalis]|uniref:Uncharacterized protein n=1 Tax=Asparagus officinalis TaxID=4686 RepID=A0A5P1EZ83_ASPOF|nr:uncharacterized protein A4U43_C04F6630 [Asparagus officinalis]
MIGKAAASPEQLVAFLPLPLPTVVFGSMDLNENSKDLRGKRLKWGRRRRLGGGSRRPLIKWRGTTTVRLPAVATSVPWQPKGGGWPPWRCGPASGDGWWSVRQLAADEWPTGDGRTAGNGGGGGGDEVEGGRRSRRRATTRRRC